MGRTSTIPPRDKPETSRHHLGSLDHYAFGVALAERGIPRQYGLTEAQEDLAHVRRQ